MLMSVRIVQEGAGCARVGECAMTGGSVSQEAVDQLRATICGETLTPVDAAYDAVRQVHNGMIDKRPAVIVRCQNTADIADAVKFAREHDLEISVRDRKSTRLNSSH